jgi:sulfatase maturation enzyme AslB (radical SAM superfamily)
MLQLLQGIASYSRTATCEFRGEHHTATFRVESVTFSGLIGEPLISKASVIAGIQFLADRNLRVGLFTNGILMDSITRETLLRASYVHISIDAGTTGTYARLKCLDQSRGQFDQVLTNVAALARLRANSPSSRLDINASFVVFPENYHELYTAARLLKSAGVDTLRIKQDNSGQRLLSADERNQALDLLMKIRSDLEDDRFRLVTIHRLDDPDEMKRSFSRCSITDIMAAVGSDGCLYPCNYHPRPGGASYGSAIDRPFSEVWEGRQRQQIKNGIPRICPTVCDPFKNRANRLLSSIHDLFETGAMDELAEFRVQASKMMSATPSLQTEFTETH